MTDSTYFKKKLNTLKTELTQRINSIDKDIRHEDMSADWEEQAVERENDEVLESLGKSSQEELQMINQALNRIESGEYFYCSICGKNIPEARLKLLPFISNCINCAENIEQQS
ncbi:MAG: TraR/DksA family transcriptional regulator [Methylococcales bacterium]|jgi:DnaK suppressor protein|nr:TraR/DksA family transcriptional regulator [Methylococcales bacterium]